jgi:hypothetical protein
MVFLTKNPTFKQAGTQALVDEAQATQTPLIG